VGLDPRIGQIPEHIKSESIRVFGDSLTAVGMSLIEFSKQIIDTVHDVVPAVKPQIAFYEQYGSKGIEAFEKTVAFAKSKGLMVIGDTKRNDIGSTARAYASGHLGEVELIDGTLTSSYDLDLVTVNPYLGSDGIIPFLEACKKYGKGIFILDKTSNPSSGELQDRKVDSKKPVFELVAEQINELGMNLVGYRGYSSVGAVVGATYPAQAMTLRSLMPNTMFLVPGYGAQGGSAEDIIPCFNKDGYGAVVNSSRGIIFAYEKEPYRNNYGPDKFHRASRQAACDMRDDVLKVLRKHDRLPDGW
jgi:orotidine-5'-phosphate decarboxylase